ncbi:hypothetical protein BGP75_23840 [Motiliproteus sp. MSK22-1]|nr:hypothetical protein BGP75_23840 [Motiliproteus sp. MSK22-1]
MVLCKAPSDSASVFWFLCVNAMAKLSNISVKKAQLIVERRVQGLVGCFFVSGPGRGRRQKNMGDISLQLR